MRESAKKYILYARKSSEAEDRQTISIDSQVQELERLAANKGIVIIETLREAKSAKEPGRPIFEAMLTMLRRGKADGIICWKINRLTRNPADGGNLQWMLQKGVIKHILTYERDYWPEDNALLMGVEMSMANQFIRDLSIDSQRGLRTKAEKGWFPGKAPLGYLHHPLKNKGEKEVINDPDKFELVKRGLKEVANGHLAPPQAYEEAVTKWGLTGRHGGKLSLSNWYSMLNNPFYYGEFEFPRESGKWYHGKHEPMISQAEYIKTQTILGRKGTTRGYKYTFPYRGILTCGTCGAMITAEHKVKRNKNGNVHPYIYYHAPNGETRIAPREWSTRKNWSDKSLSFLREISVPASFVEWALHYLKQTAPEEEKSSQIIRTQLERKEEEIDKRLSKLIDLKLGNLLTETEYAAKKQELLKEKEMLQETLSQPVPKTWLETFEETLSTAEDALQRFQKGDEKKRKEVVYNLGSNLCIKGKMFSVEAKNPVLFMKKIAKPVNTISRRFEPPDCGLDKSQLWAEYARTKPLLRGSGSNRRPSG